MTRRFVLALSLIADHGDRILTSDLDDIRRLVAAAGKRCVVIDC